MVLALFAFALTGLGFALAWMLDSTQGFHAIMNLLLFPMWILSGAVFPPGGAADWVRGAMLVNPMTYGVSALRGVLAGTEAAAGSSSVNSSLLLIVLFGVFTLVLSSWTVHYRRA